MEKKLMKEKWKFKILEGLDNLVEERGEWCNEGWGSSQYLTAHGFFKLYCEIRQDLSEEDTHEVLGLKITHNNISTFPEAKEDMKCIIEDDINSRGTPESHIDERTWETQHIERIKNSKVAEDLFDAERNAASDLWTATPLITNCFFSGLNVEGVPNSPGKGPIMNVQCQSENYMVGLFCAMLVDHGIIIDEECFGDFDT